MKQLKKYTDWLQYGDHLDLVVKAFKENCRILAEFHKLAKEINKNIAPLGAGIVAVASSDEPLLFIDESPRLLIDNRKRDASFIANGHLQKLHNLGIHVQMVNGDKPDDMKLDVLP